MFTTWRGNRLKEVIDPFDQNFPRGKLSTGNIIIDHCTSSRYCYFGNVLNVWLKYLANSHENLKGIQLIKRITMLTVWSPPFQIFFYIWTVAYKVNLTIYKVIFIVLCPLYGIQQHKKVLKIEIAVKFCRIVEKRW